ncbi:MAG: GNAT family N-acetyltransferase [Candidatus Aenigmarchaeota archaeon]|nr:GNAT family N-acetyltransferase [Candidatus Aenigmarchaeota archaeon]
MEKNGERVVIRFLKKSDSAMLLKYIHGLVDERAKIMMNRKPSIKEEREYVSDCISKCRRGRNVHIVAECGKNIIASMQLRGGEGVEHKCGELSMGVAFPYRKQGIASRMFMLLQVHAKENGFDTIISSYYSNNAASSNFHERFGFKIVGQVPNSIDYYGKRLGKVVVYRVLR